MTHSLHHLPCLSPQGPVRNVATVTAPRPAAGTRQGRRLGSLSVFGHIVTTGHRLQDTRTLVSPAGGSGLCPPKWKEKQRSRRSRDADTPPRALGTACSPPLSCPLCSGSLPAPPALLSSSAPSHFCPLALSLSRALMPLLSRGVTQPYILSRVLLHHSSKRSASSVNINKSVAEQILGTPAGVPLSDSMPDHHSGHSAPPRPPDSTAPVGSFQTHLSSVT